MNKDLIPIILSVSVIVFFLVMLVRASIKDAKDREQAKIDDQAWLDNELKYSSYVSFTTSDGVLRRGRDCLAYDTDIGSKWGIRRTSKQYALNVLSGNYERGFFRDEKDETYPTCNILSSKVVTNDNRDESKA